MVDPVASGVMLVVVVVAVSSFGVGAAALALGVLAVGVFIFRSRAAVGRRAAGDPLRRHLPPRPAHREVHAGDAGARALRNQPDPSAEGWKRLRSGALAAEWIASGFAHPEAAELWDAEGFGPDEAGAWRPVARPRSARTWIAAGFGPQEAAAWLAVGCDDPIDAAQRRAEGMVAADLDGLRAAGGHRAAGPGPIKARRRRPGRRR